MQMRIFIAGNNVDAYFSLTKWLSMVFLGAPNERIFVPPLTLTYIDTYSFNTWFVSPQTIHKKNKNLINNKIK